MDETERFVRLFACVYDYLIHSEWLIIREKTPGINELFFYNDGTPKSKIINRAKCLAISQVIRAKYTIVIFYLSLKKFFLLLCDTMSYFLFHIPPHIHFYFGPYIPMLPCLVCCLHKS